MERLIDAKSVKDFVSSTYDPNDLHENEVMWERYKIPGLVPGMQLLCRSLATMKPEELKSVNYGITYFQNPVFIGSTVDLGTKPQIKGILNREIQGYRVSAHCNGVDALAEKKEFSFFARRDPSEAFSCYQGMNVFSIRPNDMYLTIFEEATELSADVSKPYYALALSSASIAFHIRNPNAPAFLELNKGIIADKVEAKKIPTYDSVEFYFPDGLKDFSHTDELLFRSAISRSEISDNNPHYTIDTICSTSKSDEIYRARAVLRQFKQESLFSLFGRSIDRIGRSGKTKGLEGIVERRKNALTLANSTA